MEINELNAQFRPEVGKGYARRLRSRGLIPAVCYGPGQETLPLAVSAAELAAIRKRGGKALIKLKTQKGEQKIEKLSLLKELQVEPLTREYVHADFYEITMDQELTFDIEIHFSGKPKGVTDGGDLHLLKRELRVSCMPTQCPDAVDVDLSDLSIGGSYRVQEITLPEGIKILDHGDVAIATVSAARVVAPAAEEAAAPAAAAEPEAK